MLELRIDFSYGLKDWLGDDFIKEGTNVLVGSKFPPLVRKSIRFFRDHVHKLTTCLSPRAFLNKVN